MNKAERYEIEAKTPFAESLIWELNRGFYQEIGIRAWSDGIVPHNMTSNSKAGKTYAELIFAFLKDLAAKGNTADKVYILELGAGHGRLAFHILKHLQVLTESINEPIPDFCYVLSDIVEKNLSFFHQHPQLQDFFEQGKLDLAFFDASQSENLELRYAKETIFPGDLNQPILAIANYFFDSIPTELFLIQNSVISSCSVSIHSKDNTAEMNEEEVIKNMELVFHSSVQDSPVFEEGLHNEILEEYRTLLPNTYLFFPNRAMLCLQHIKAFSRAGLLLLTMDKGFHELHNLQNKQQPEVITHGSFSFWVNFHALGVYCKKQGGKVLFPRFSNFHLELGCLFFLPEGDSYLQTDAAYQQFVNNFGPDDFNSMKQMAYFNVSRLTTKELIALSRLSAYDSSFFIKLLPRLRQVSQAITFNERNRIAQTMANVWNMYFHINENVDLAYEMGGIFYDLGYYTEALNYFDHSVNLFGWKADIYYNQALCYYQLRQDVLFYKTLNDGKDAFPEYQLFNKLDKLDMS